VQRRDLGHSRERVRPQGKVACSGCHTQLREGHTQSLEAGGCALPVAGDQQQLLRAGQLLHTLQEVILCVAGSQVQRGKLLQPWQCYCYCFPALFSVDLSAVHQLQVPQLCECCETAEAPGHAVKAKVSKGGQLHRKPRSGTFAAVCANHSIGLGEGSSDSFESEVPTYYIGRINFSVKLTPH
jgi:hypothetical protein